MQKDLKVVLSNKDECLEIDRFIRIECENPLNKECDEKLNPVLQKFTQFALQPKKVCIEMKDAE